jgi:exopolysaccharide biosynthesis polyprenyl glycosylphosphotransferase
MLKENWRPIRSLWAVSEGCAAAAIQLYLMTYPPHAVLGSPGSSAGPLEMLGISAAAAIGSLVALRYFGAYGSQRRRTLHDQLQSLVLAGGALALCFSAAAFTMALPVPAAMPAVFAACLVAALAAVRIPGFLALHALRRSGRNVRNILMIGTGPRAARAEETIEEHPEWGLCVVGFVDDSDFAFAPAIDHGRIHKLIDLPRLLCEEAVDEVLVACPRSMLPELEPAVQECSLIGVPITFLTDLFGSELPPPREGRFGGQGTLSYAPVHHDQTKLGVKRALDIVGGIVGLVLSAPILLLAAAAIKWDDGGTIFFRQWRCGLNGHPFQMNKLRTMVPQAESLKADLLALNEMDGPVFKITDDPRTTRVGRLLRKWSIDELPQFWNVVTGQMSLVGPRPPTPDEVAAYQGGDRRRLSMRPGLTCLWQISGRNEIDFEEWMRLDRQYIDSWSPAGDLAIMLRTIPQILLRRGAS